ncbi:MAG: DUF1624 domain-containing protein [Ardenticatenaceae bacterium]|nr:DUF1624 domain-containing protein [Ardenticatenaceae bacterium]
MTVRIIGMSDYRYTPLDSLRGFIMVVMALDHANSFIAHGKRELELWYFLFPNYNGDNLAFLTRFVTHLAAPGFFFLMGAGMALFTLSRRARNWTNRQIVSHFLLRGALLILLQFLLENPAWDIGTDSSALDYFGVLYALGGAMMIGSLLVLLPNTAVFPLSLLLILTTEALLPAAPTTYATFPTAQLLFYIPGFGDIFVPQTLVLYPILPWLGVMGLGLGYGRFLHQSPQRTIQLPGYLALAALLAFIPLRLLSPYGNIRPLPTNYDWIGFLNLVKYPPSLTFLLLTLGINLLLLRLFFWLETQSPISSLQSPLPTFGREPLFFYITHLYLYGVMGLWLNRAATPTIAHMYPYWLLGLVILWPLCWAYGKWKNGRSPTSLWRFL